MVYLEVQKRWRTVSARKRERMYRLRGRVVFAALVAVGVSGGLFGVGPAVAATPDMTISIAGHPATVSPPGALALYRITVTNAVGKQTFTNVVVVHTMASGGQFDAALTANGCTNPSGDGITVTCTIASLAPRASAVIDIFTATPTTPGVATSTATIDDSSPAENRKNNTASTTTNVVADATKAAGFFTPGSYGVGNQLLQVPAGAGKGVVTAMSLEDHTPYCGTSCIFSGDAVRIDFPLQDPNYKVIDPLNPLTVELDMGFSSPPCKGLGGTCDDLRYIDHLGQTGIVPFCNGASGTSEGPAVALPSSPCKYHQFKSDDGHVHFKVALLSNDPTLV